MPATKARCIDFIADTSAAHDDAQCYFRSVKMFGIRFFLHRDPLSVKGLKKEILKQ